MVRLQTIVEDILFFCWSEGK